MTSKSCQNLSLLNTHKVSVKQKTVKCYTSRSFRIKTLVDEKRSGGHLKRKMSKISISMVLTNKAMVVGSELSNGQRCISYASGAKKEFKSSQLLGLHRST